MTCDSKCEFDTSKCTGGSSGSCGNNRIDTGEQCEGTNWGPITDCNDFDNFTGGTLTCGNDCKFDTSACTGGGTRCGDGLITAGEQCDGTNWGPIKDCRDFDNFTGGTLTCDSNCKFNTSKCSGGTTGSCGNGRIDTGEQCEGTNWGPITGCNDFDTFSGGNLKCGVDCKFDTSACTGGGLCGNGRIDSNEECDEGSANGPWPNRCSDICKTNTITIQTADPANQSCDSLESYVNAVADITNNGGPTPIYYGFEYFRGRKVGSNFEPTTYINTTPIQSTYNNGKTRPYRITLPMESGIYCYQAFAQDDPDLTKRKFWLGAPYAKCFEVKCPVSQCSDQITIVKPRNNDQVSIINGKFDANWALTQGSGVSHVVKYRWVISGKDVYQNTETALTGATVDISKGGVGAEYTFGVYGYTADGSLCGSARSAINFIASDCCTDGTCVNIGTKDGEFDLPTGHNPALFVNSVGSRVEMKEELATLSTLEGIKWLDWAGQPLNISNLKQFTHIRIQLPPPKLTASVPGGGRDKVYEMEYSDVARANFALQNSIANTTNFSYADLEYSPLPFFGGQAGPRSAGEKYFNVQATNQFMAASCPPDAAANEVCFIAANSSNLSEDAQLTVVRPELFTYQTFNNSYFKECKYQRASESRDFKIDAGEWPMAVSCSATCNSDCDKSIFTVNQIKRCEAFDLNSCKDEPNKDKYRYVWYCNSQGGKVDSWEHFEAMDSGNPFTQCKVVVMTKDGAFRSEGELGGNPSSEAICTAQCEACTGNICTINKASVQDINGSSCPDVQNINVSVDVGNDCQFEAMEYAVIDANTGEEVFSRKVNSKVASITASPSGSDLTYGSRQYYAVVRVKAQKGGWSANAQTERFSTLPHKPPQAFFNIELVDNKGKVVLHGWHNGDSAYSPFTYTWNIYLRDNNNNFTEKYLSGNKQDFTIGLQRKDQKIELIVQDSEGLTCSTSTEVGPKTHPIWGGGGI